MKCVLGCPDDRLSDDDASEPGDVNDGMVVLPPEQLNDDATLIQEMEMGRQLWTKLPACK